MFVSPLWPSPHGGAPHGSVPPFPSLGTSPGAAPVTSSGGLGSPALSSSSTTSSGTLPALPPTLGHGSHMCHRKVKKSWRTSDGRSSRSVSDSDVTAPSPVATAPQTDTKPRGRFGHTVVVRGNDMILFGGRNGTDLAGDLWSFHLETSCWRELPWRQVVLRPLARAGHTATLVPTSSGSLPANSMIVVGGAVSRADNANDVWVLLDPVEKCEWRLLHGGGTSSDLPRPRRGHTATLHNHELYVFGGCDDDRVWIFQPSSTTWRVLLTTGVPPRPRTYHIAESSADGRLIVFGGLAVAEPGVPSVVTSSSEFLNDVHVLHLGANAASRHQWNRITCSGPVPTPRMCMTSYFDQGSLCVLSGGSTRFHDDCYELDTTTWTWSLTGPGPLACTRPTVVRHGNRIVMWGGCKGNDGYSNDAHVILLEPLSLKEACRHWLMGVPSGLLDMAQVPEHIRDLADHDDPRSALEREGAHDEGLESVVDA